MPCRYAPSPEELAMAAGAMLKPQADELTRLMCLACQYIQDPDSINDEELDQINDWYVAHKETAGHEKEKKKKKAKS